MTLGGDRTRFANPATNLTAKGPKDGATAKRAGKPDVDGSYLERQPLGPGGLLSSEAVFRRSTEHSELFVDGGEQLGLTLTGGFEGSGSHFGVSLGGDSPSPRDVLMSPPALVNGELFRPAPRQESRRLADDGRHAFSCCQAGSLDYAAPRLRE